MNTYEYVEHQSAVYISALEELLQAYCEERRLRHYNTKFPISRNDAKYAVDLKHRVRKLLK